VVGLLAIRGCGTWLAALAQAVRGLIFAPANRESRRTFQRRLAWTPLATLVVCFVAVHTMYWSNLRMRAPIMPAICLWAAAATRRKDA
jgi:hypothetical protein